MTTNYPLFNFATLLSKLSNDVQFVIQHDTIKAIILWLEWLM